MPTIPNKLIPAYIPWETFTGFIGHLKTSVVPTHIDKSMMPSDMPGLTKGQVQSALKFLRLIDRSGAVREPLSSLVESYKTDTWPTAVAEVIKEPYRGIVGDLDIHVATQHQVDGKFKTAGVDGQMLQKSLRFYLAALKDAGMTYSPHLGARKKQATQPKKKQRTGKSHATKDHAKSKITNNLAAEKVVATPAIGMRTYPLYFRDNPKGSLVVPENLTIADCKVIELQLEVLKASTEDAGT